MSIQIYVSTQADGTMKSDDDNFKNVYDNRKKFLSNHEISIENTTKISVTFDTKNFTRYKTIDCSAKGNGMIRPQTIICDALVVTKLNHALFLPLADCVGAVIYNLEKNILMVSHLGRHSLEQNGGIKSVKYLEKIHNVRPSNLKIWLSPAAGAKNYPLFAFNNKSLHQVAVEQFLSAGVKIENITVSPIDTTNDKTYYSHSQYLLGRRPNDGRFAIAAVINN